MRHRVRHYNPVSAGCQVVLDARYLAGLANDAAVATWTSRPGGLYGATASGTSQPTFKASSINGRPAVQFDGSNDFMDWDAGVRSLTNNATGLLVIAVVVADNPAADTTQNVILLTTGSSSSSARFAMRAVFSAAAAGAVSGRRLDADTLVGTGAATGSTASPAIIQGYADWTNNLLACRTNGGTQATVAFSSGGGNASNTSSQAAKLGAQDVGAIRLAGRIGAICISVPLLPAALRMRIRQHYGFSFRIGTS